MDKKVAAVAPLRATNASLVYSPMEPAECLYDEKACKGSAFF